LFATKIVKECLINNTFISLLMDDHHHFSYITKYEEPLVWNPMEKWFHHPYHTIMEHHPSIIPSIILHLPP
jgi:hypothetical protein